MTHEKPVGKIARTADIITELECLAVRENIVGIDQPVPEHPLRDVEWMVPAGAKARAAERAWPGGSA